MSFDLQGVRDATAINLATMRKHAIYLAAQRSDRRIQKARNVADLLERGHRARLGHHTALVLDVKA
ncbi:MAG: hypothetical protein Q8R82_00750 [Hyphomonadaceae bacterium]|nr:hypothetical protein [Hyphomonadaceae bacterium]